MSATRYGFVCAARCPKLDADFISTLPYLLEPKEKERLCVARAKHLAYCFVCTCTVFVSSKGARGSIKRTNMLPSTF